MTRILLSVLILLSYTAPAQVTILQENFNSGMPSAWMTINNDGLSPYNDPAVNFVTDAWVASAAMEVDSTGDLDLYSTSWYNPAGTADDWLITPQITLGAYGNFLRWQARSEDASFPDGYLVLASKTGTAIGDFTDTLFITGSEIPTWQNREISLDSSGLTSETIYIAFVNNSTDKFLLLLDNISVEIDNPLSTSNTAMPKLSIFPNPASERVFIHATPGAYITVRDVAGKVLTQRKINQATTELSTSNWAKGIYFVTVEYQATSTTQKLILK